MGFSSELVPPATEPEREEGEIIEVMEYEEISSDEEINLRQRIGELEARNQELEKIASISSAKACDYGKLKDRAFFNGLFCLHATSRMNITFNSIFFEIEQRRFI